MNEKIIQDIAAAAAVIESLKADLKVLVKKFQDSMGISFPQNDVIPGGDYTLSEILASLTTLGTSTETISKNEGGGVLVPRVLLSAFLAKQNEISNQLIVVKNIFQAVEDTGGPGQLDVSDFTVTSKNGTAHPFAKQFRRLFDTLDGAFAAWYPVRFVTRIPRIGDFAKYATEIETQKHSVQNTLRRAEELTEQIDNKNSESEGVLEQSREAGNELTRITQEAQSARRTLAEYDAEATAKLGQIRLTDERAAGLFATISNYQSTFDSFDAQLANRNKRFEDESAALLSLKDDLTKQQGEVTRLVAESEGLLRGATNVGLAASFSGLEAKIGSELRWAAWSFYFSIVFLVLLSLPIALYVFPGLQSLLRAVFPDVPDIIVPKSVDPHTTQDILAQIAARALLLIPGVWLVRFAGARHERLFRLREHYAYKYSIASSVEGFKKQAPDLEQAIAATAFYELTFNPATRMDANSSEARHPNPAMEWLMKKLGGSSEGAKPDVKT